MQTKLKLVGVESIYLASVRAPALLARPSCVEGMSAVHLVLTLSVPCFVQSGEQVTRLDDLQDIDELHVVEVCLLAPWLTDFL